MVILGCAPPPGTYDPRSPAPKVIKGAKFDKSERFKEPSVPQVNNILIFYLIFIKCWYNNLLVSTTLCIFIFVNNCYQKYSWWL